MKLLLVSRVEDIDVLKGMLDKEGIVTEVTDDTMPLPGAVFYPKLWVRDDGDFSRASAVLNAFRGLAPPKAGVWICPSCREQLEGQFLSCWNCGSNRPEPDDAPPSTVPQPSTQQPQGPTGTQVALNFLGGSVGLLVAGLSLWQVIWGRSYVTLHEFEKTGYRVTVYFPLLFVLSGVTAAVFVRRAFSLMSRERNQRHEKGA